MTEENKNNFKRQISDILSSTFLVMKCCGIWQPFHTLFLRIIYLFYSIFMILLILTTGLALICLLVFSPTNKKELIVENSFLLFTLLNGWTKAAVILCKHRDIKNLLHTLLEDQCQPQDKTELVIQQKFDNEARKVNVVYSLMVATAVILMYTSIFTIKKSEERAAALNTWRPYDFKDDYFKITWLHEFFAHFATASVHMAVDSLVPGFIIQLCCQLKFFEHRINNFPYQIEKLQITEEIKRELELSFISKFVVHHITMFRYGERIKNIFVEVLFSQFFSSLLVICLTVYKLSKEPLNYGNTMTLVPYVICMLAQLFIYCWYANELMLNSRDLQKTIFETNWFSLSNETKRSLIIMMIRSKKPIVISIGSVLFVNLNSFASILKTSYSAYNVLQHSI